MVQFAHARSTAPARRSDTRERLLELAEAAVLAKGFAATSIEELIAAVGITKSGFFYHFKDKGELAKAMMLRYLEHDKAVLDEIFRARRRAQRGSAARLPGRRSSCSPRCWPNLPEAHPGCLAASFCYQDQLFDREIRELNADGVLRWRERFRERLDAIAKRYPPRSASRSRGARRHGGDHWSRAD